MINSNTETSAIFNSRSLNEDLERFPISVSTATSLPHFGVL